MSPDWLEAFPKMLNASYHNTYSIVFILEKDHAACFRSTLVGITRQMPQLGSKPFSICTQLTAEPPENVLELQVSTQAASASLESIAALHQGSRVSTYADA